MANSLRALRWRAAAALVGAGLVIAWVVMAGGTTHIIQIDYRWGGPFLDSAQVEIDGEIVGILQRYGRSNYATGFEVGPGEHVVRVLREDCDGTPKNVRSGGDDGRLASFMADVEEGSNVRVARRPQGRAPNMKPASGNSRRARSGARGICSAATARGPRPRPPACPGGCTRC